MITVVYRPDPQNWIQLSHQWRRAVYQVCQRVYGVGVGLTYPEIDNADDAQILYAEARDFRRRNGWYVWEDIMVIPTPENTEVYDTDVDTEDYE